MKKITILQEELQADIKTIEIDETACRTIISCQIKTQDQVIILLSRINIASFGSLRLDLKHNFGLVRQSVRNVSSSQPKTSSPPS